MKRPDYERGDRVEFQSFGRTFTGVIEIVDAHGTLDQHEEPSYDITVPEKDNAIFKHIRESWVIGKLAEGEDAYV